GIVVSGNIHMRKGPDRNQPIIKILAKGQKVVVIKHIDGWLKVSHEGHVGYIRNKSSYVRISSPVTKPPSEKKIDIKPSRDIDHLQQEAKKISNKIEQSKAEIVKITKKEYLVINSLNDQDIAINSIRKNISVLRNELSVINRQIETINNESKAAAKEIENLEHYVSKRLVALYKLNWLGRMHLLASVDSVDEFFQRKKYLELILNYDKKAIDKLFENRNRLDQLQSNLNARQAKQQSGEQNLEKQIRNINVEREKRNRLLEEIRSKKSLEIAAIKSLEEAARTLDNVIKSLYTETDKTDHPDRASLKGLDSLKGLLIQPVKGKIISHFGAYSDPKYNVANFRSGIDIAAERGEPIKSVVAGKIIYSGWFKGYGNMIIIDHGESYYTVYAHLEENFKSKGDLVETEEVIATAGDAGSLSGPGLYFEMRHHGKPVDPVEWFKPS
ncbi:MAG: SH3b protein, partial [Thermodesulfobacteriota bacterium]|nr:SH3b protein [Thermodesulfobacteriota bacterium]